MGGKKIYVRSTAGRALAIHLTQNDTWDALFESQTLSPKSLFARGEWRELAGPITLDEQGLFVIPTVAPRTVEDVKEEIIKVLGEWVDEPGEPASSHGRRMTALIQELRHLQAKAGQ